MIPAESKSVVDSARCLRVPALNRAVAGASFKHEHLRDILSDGIKEGFFEVHAENYMGEGGPPHRALEAIRRDYPLSIHGVCMSIGGLQPLDRQHLERFRRVISRYQPELVSEHLAWSTHSDTFFNDLLPVPYTQATFARVCKHIDQVQEAIGRPILLENPSTYIAFESSTISEADFLRAVAERTGCGLLLDVNNVFVSAINQGYTAGSYLDSFPIQHVGEIHLAGHTRQLDEKGAPLLIDSHDEPVSENVWALYDDVIRRIGPTPTLVEWDSQIPAWSILRAQAGTAHKRMMSAEVFSDEGVDHVA